MYVYVFIECKVERGRKSAGNYDKVKYRTIDFGNV